MQKKLVALCVSSLMLSGCAGLQGGVSGANKASGMNTMSYVDQQMLHSVQAIEKTVNTLLIIEKGAPSQPMPALAIDSTVASEKAPKVQVRQVSMEPMGKDGLPIQLTKEEQEQKDFDALLSKHVKLHWAGDVVGFLDLLSSNTGYDVEIRGKGSFPEFIINSDDILVKDVLLNFASQINSAADVNVVAAQKRIFVIFH